MIQVIYSIIHDSCSVLLTRGLIHLKYLQLELVLDLKLFFIAYFPLQHRVQHDSSTNIELLFELIKI